MKNYVVQNKKELTGDALKNKIQVWIKGKAYKAGDKASLDPTLPEIKESIAMGWIKELEK